jgi:hypothetical protein
MLVAGNERKQRAPAVHARARTQTHVRSRPGVLPPSPSRACCRTEKLHSGEKTKRCAGAWSSQSLAVDSHPSVRGVASPSSPSSPLPAPDEATSPHGPSDSRVTPGRSSPESTGGGTQTKGQPCCLAASRMPSTLLWLHSA